MVTRWGFSDELGTVAYGENQDEVFLGHSVARQQNVSEETAQKIDAEVRRLIEEAYTEATPDPDREAGGLRRRSPRRCSNTRRCPATRSSDLIAGKPPVRDRDDDAAEPLGRRWCRAPARAAQAPGAGRRHGAAAAGLSQSALSLEARLRRACRFRQRTLKSRRPAAGRLHLVQTMLQLGNECSERKP